MRSFYRIGSKWMFALLAIVMLVAVGCSSSDDNDNGNNPPTNHAPQNLTITLSTTSLPSSGGNVTVNASATDSDANDQLTYTFGVSPGSVNPTSSTNGQTTWTLPANTGTSVLQGTITVTVSDGTASVQNQAGVTIAAAAAATTGISGTLSLQAGASGNLDNTQVSIYPDLNAWNTYAPSLYVAAVGQGLGATATYSMSPVAQGTWYLDAWKDNDGSLTWSVGDLVGWYGSGGLSSPSLSSFSLAQNEQKVINIVNMIPVP